MPLQQNKKNNLPRQFIAFFVFFFFFFLVFTDYKPKYTSNPPEKEYLMTAIGPKGPLAFLDQFDRYKIEKKEKALSVALKADDMLATLQEPLKAMDLNPPMDDGEAQG